MGDCRFDSELLSICVCGKFYFGLITESLSMALEVS